MAATETSDGVSSDTEVATPSPVKLQYAIKTSLSLMLAYLIPMALGWPQPQTAATTVMLIAATGTMSESLQKGVLRILGTVAGAVIGLSLIALFPQDRMVYLLAVSCTVAIILYLYNAYQGDSTILMLTAVVTLMVFNGGDAEGAFLYGIDRAFMTAFGVIIYTVVASMLWPVKTADNIRALAGGLAKKYRLAFSHLVQHTKQPEGTLNNFLSELLTDGTSFETQFASVKNYADGVADYLPEWNCVTRGYEDLKSTLLPALKQDSGRSVDYRLYIDNYDLMLDRVDALFRGLDAAWHGQRSTTEWQTLEITFSSEKLHQGTHLQAAAVITRAELLQKTQRILLDLLTALDSLLFDKGPLIANVQPQGKPTFVWLDGENLKTALRAFVTFWIATGIWITFNPPGGFMFVTLSTVLIPLVSYTPVTPKLLFILFTLGFLFALPAYIFLLPQMSHWLELAIFLFGYAFIGFYIFQGPVSIFFLLGLFTLGIQNNMAYNVDAIMLIIVMFYMVCTTLIVSVHFPFSSKPERIYASLRRRFFRHCARQLRLAGEPASFTNNLRLACLGSGAPLLTKMATWGPQIDGSFFNDDADQPIAALNRACELLLGQLQVSAVRRDDFRENSLITAARHNSSGKILAEMCEKLANLDSTEEPESPGPNLNNIEAGLDELLGDDFLSRYGTRELAQFYIYLNLQASIFASLAACAEAQQALDWQRLGETRF
jgi:hypothetical protein